MLAALRRRRATIALLALACLLGLLGVASTHDASHEGEVVAPHCAACLVAHSPSLATAAVEIAHDRPPCAESTSCASLPFAGVLTVRTEPSRGPPARA